METDSDGEGVGGWALVTAAFMFLSAVFDAAAPVMARYGLHQKSLVLLAVLDAADTPRALAELLHSPPSTVSHLLREVEDRGLIARSVDAHDRRRFRLRRTPEGDAALAAGIAAIDASVHGCMATLTEAERGTAAAALPLLLRLGGR